MKLRILNVAYPFAETGRDAVGGAEQVLTYLDEALVHEGHDSIVIAAAGSNAAGSLCPIKVPPGPITDGARATVYSQVRSQIAEIIDSHSVDLIHMHGIDFFNYLPSGELPVLVTLHLPLDWYPAEALAPQRPNLFLHGVSEFQTNGATAPLLPPIGNGVPIEEFASTEVRRNFALCLGRICLEKGFHFALEAAADVQMPIVLAGKVYPYPAHQDYFRNEIVPRLSRLARFIGPANFAQKRRLLSAARCLLIPSLVAETSSLVAMEALACGTPVIAFRKGALPEIIAHGKTGFLVDSADEMSEAIRQVHRLNPETCRSAAREHYDLRHTVARYFATYRKLIVRYVEPVHAREGEVCYAA